jgi:hypothetical protein
MGDTVSEMKFETAQQTNGVLIDSYAALVAAGDGCSDAVKLSKAVICDELERRNAELRAALDAWESDLESDVTHDQVVLRFARAMKRDCRFHH